MTEKHKSEETRREVDFWFVILVKLGRSKTQNSNSKEKKMKKLFMIFMIFGLVFIFVHGVWAESNKVQCVTIQSGELVGSDGNVINVGYDSWGYNYQARLFNGFYCDSYRDAVWCQPYKDIELMMKWNDAWLSNKDCDGDGLLDRHFGYDSYIGSGAWLTNHQSGWVEVNGKMRKWTYFVKIVAAPEDAYTENGFWYAADGIEIGPVIWGAFATIQQVSNDPSAGEHGILYKSPSGPGLGKW